MEKTVAHNLNNWWLATRTPSLLKVALPLGLGLAMGYGQTGEIRPVYILFALLFGWLDQLYIIFFNDYADSKADILHSKKYPELIDKRVIPNGLIQPRSILAAGAISALLVLLLGAALSLWFDRAFAFPMIIFALLILFAYSFKPIKLNYRGGGELLETLGVGLFLPIMGFYLYTGKLSISPIWIAPLIFTTLAGSISSGLKHVPADRETGKKTVAVLFGSQRATTIMIALVLVSILYCSAATALEQIHIFTLPLTVLVPIFFAAKAINHQKNATYKKPKDLKSFKQSVARVIYSTQIGLGTSYILLG